MRIFLEKGNETEDGIDFVRWVGNWSVDVKITVPRWEWESWGQPDRLVLEPRPVF